MTRSLCLVTFVLLSLTAFCATDDKPSDLKTAKKSSETVKCYQCNSQNKEQSDCGSTDGDVLQKYIKPCERIKEGTYKGKEANSCRKVHQNVVAESAIIRECAYDGDEPVHGRRRTGNKGISLYIYQCFHEDGSDTPCNSASTVGASALFAAALALIFIF